MINAKDYTDRLTYLVRDRRTLYNNHYPYNCGYIWPAGQISFDCIGMVKSVINEPDIVYRTQPAGYKVIPGRVIYDSTERGLLALCSGVRWGDFNKVANAEYLYMEGHAGIYLAGNPDVNVIECTTDWNGGVVASWVDPDGTRRSWREGAPLGRWEAHGKLDRYIIYKEEKAKKKTLKEVAAEVIAGKWGNAPERFQRLKAAGYDPEKVQALVNKMLKS